MVAENVPIEERLGVNALAAVIMNFQSDGIAKYDEMVHALDGRVSYRYSPQKVNLDLKNKTTLSARPSIEESLMLELKSLPSHLQYTFLGADNTLSIIIDVNQIVSQVEALISVLQMFKRVIV